MVRALIPAPLVALHGLLTGGAATACTNLAQVGADQRRDLLVDAYQHV
jgi:hypothetical protein